MAWESSTQDWFWSGTYGRHHSQEFAHAWHESMTGDPDPPISAFSNARLHAEHCAALRERALDRPTAVGDTLIPTPAVWPAEDGYFLPPDAKFEIAECLQVGPERFSQTFTARVVSSEVLDEHFVVLKIYQDSLGKNQYLDPPPSLKDLAELEPIQASDDSLQYIAATEAAAYQHLEVLQGSVLPWFCGTFSLDLPCGETALGLVLEYINAPTMEEAAFEPSERLKEWDAARVQRYQHLLRATLKAMYAFNRCCVMHGDVAQRNFLVQEDGEKTTAVIIDLGEATLTCSSADASSDMAEVHSFFAQWRLDRRWRAEVADGLRFKIPGANWEPTGPVPQGDGSVFVRG